MVFTSHVFIFFFLPLFLLVYFSLPFKWRNFWITVASYAFYGWWNPWFVLLLVFVTVVNYLGGLLMTRDGASERQRFWGVTLAVVLSLATLGFFKYFMFCQANLNHVLSWLGADGVHVLQIALPTGISFYVFKALSYSFDVYRGPGPPARSWRDFAGYLALFPQLEAGPIERFRNVAGQLAHRLPPRFASGVALFVLGFAKKVLLANPVGEIATVAFSAQSLTTGDAWFGALAYAFQIYFDFSGYSDMAVGLGRMIGLEFMKNFDSPYLAESITEFWRRWHISLSSWFRDYVFLPLELATRDHPHAGRRVSINLMLTMLLVGLWHGASWTFVAWGGYHGALMVFERWWGKHSAYRRLPRRVRVAVTFVLVLISWVLFRSDNFSGALDYLRAMVGAGATGEGAALLAAQLYIQGKLVLMALSALLVLWPTQAHEWSAQITWPKALALVLAFGLALMGMFSQAFKPFLYFQF